MGARHSSQKENIHQNQDALTTGRTPTSKPSSNKGIGPSDVQGAISELKRGAEKETSLYPSDTPPALSLPESPLARPKRVMPSAVPLIGPAVSAHLAKRGSMPSPVASSSSTAVNEKDAEVTNRPNQALAPTTAKSKATASSAGASPVSSSSSPPNVSTKRLSLFLSAPMNLLSRTSTNFSPIEREPGGISNISGDSSGSSMEPSPLGKVRERGKGRKSSRRSSDATGGRGARWSDEIGADVNSPDAGDVSEDDQGKQ